MADAPSLPDPRDEYAALVRAVAARLELERSFGLDAVSVPEPPPPPAPQAQAPPRRRAAPRTAAPKPTPARPAPRKPTGPPTHVSTARSTNLFEAKDYDIKIPDGLSKQEQLDFLANAISGCELCPLHAGRTKMVFGAGNPDADLMFIGEAPGRDEDLQGIPFVGRAGQLLTKIIEAIEFTRDDVYIANINKCRPPNNRAPLPEEMSRCLPFLLRQVEIVEPKVICLLGATAVRGLLQVKEGITKLRGKFLEWRGVLVMPTFHPAYLLRNPAGKRDVWSDVQQVRDAVRGTK